jgi:hypothetical protein
VGNNAHFFLDIPGILLDSGGLVLRIQASL